MNNKLFYVTPESELILVRFEECILSTTVVPFKEEEP